MPGAADLDRADIPLDERVEAFLLATVALPRLAGPEVAARTGVAIGAMEAGAVLGLEHEFSLFAGDAAGPRVAFGLLFAAVKSAAAPTVEHFVAPGVHLDDGTLLTIDGDEAEIAIAPLPGNAAGIAAVAPAVAAAHARFLQVLAGAPRAQSLARLFVRGYSTHVSIACPFVDLAALTQRYATTVAPAMMLMLDLPSGPGLLVRPRARRLEIGGEYLPPDDRLDAAVTFAAASTLQIAGAGVVGTSTPPLAFASAAVEASTQRPGWFVPRDAFGDDLYGHGRRATLRLRDGSTVSANHALARTWDWCRATAVARFGAAAAARVDAAVAGAQPLPCESADAERDRAVGTVDAGAPSSVNPDGRGRTDARIEAAAGDAIAAFRALAHGLRVAGLDVRLASSGWHRSIVRAERRGRDHRFEIRRPLLPLLVAAIRDGAFGTFLDGQSHAATLGAPTPAAAPVAASAGGALPAVGKPEAVRPIPQRAKKDEEDTCAARLLEDSDPYPIVEVCIPETRDTLVPNKLQEPPVNAARGGAGVFLHNGGLGHEHVDLRVKAIGFDFVFRRCYRSFIEHDGVMGLRWDHGYNQRVVPARPAGARSMDDGWCELYTGPDSSRSGDLLYYSGTGRRTLHQFASWHDRKVRAVDQHGTLVEFRAVVTIYARNPGERALLQRYAVFAGPLPWGEPVFYTRRGHDGALQVFNCHGALIALRDRHRNTMRFEYWGELDPGRRYPVLKRIVDPSARPYTLAYTPVAGSPRLTSLADEFGRTVRFVYSASAELIEMHGPPGQHAQHRWLYAYAGAAGRLAEVTAPEAVAQGTGSCIEARYDADERVVWQRHGSRDGRAGGEYNFVYQGDWVRSLFDRCGVEHVLEFRDHLGSRVAYASEVDARIPAHAPPGASARPTTRFDYDDEFQVRRVDHPSGVVEERTWAATGRPVTVGDERDWVERDWTLVDNLAAGNLLAETITSPRGGDAPRRTRWRYEPLFNCTERERAPAGTTRWRYDHGFSATPERNGNPYRIERAPRLQPDGTRVPVVETLSYRAGGLLAECIDPDGVRSVYAHDGAGVLVADVHDADHLSLTIRHVTDDRGRVTQSTDPCSATTTYEYDDRDNLVATTDAMAHTLHHVHDHEDRVVDTWTLVGDDPAPFPRTTAATPLQCHQRREYDFLGRLASETIDAGGLDLRIERDHDPEGRVTLVRSPRATGGSAAAPAVAAAIRGFEYDGRGLTVAEFSGANALRRAFAHDDDGRLVWLREPDGALTTYELNGFGEATAIRDPVGGVEALERDAAGRVMALRRLGTAGGPSPVDRGGAGNVLLAEARFAHDAEGHEVSRTDVDMDPQSLGPPRLLTTQWWRTPAGRVRDVVDAAGRHAVTTWDTAGRIAWETASAGVLLRYEYDDCGRVVAQHHDRFAPGDPVAPATSALAGKREFKYDALGRVVEESVGGAVTRHAYDSLGRLRATHGPADSHREYVYDGAGRCVRIVVETGPSGFNPTGRYELTTDHDRNGNVVARRDGLGHVTSCRYDEHDRMVATTSPSGATTAAALDAAGRAVTVTGAGGALRINAFDAAGRVIAQVHPDAGGVVHAQVFEYDGLARCVRAVDPGGSIVTREYSLVGRLMRERQDTFAVGYEYEPSGLATAVTYPSATRVGVQRFADGRVEAITADGAELARYRWIGELPRRRATSAWFENAATGTGEVREILERRDYRVDGRLAALEHVARGPGVYEQDLAPMWRFVYRGGLLVDKLSASYGIALQHDRAQRLLRETYEPIRDIPDITRRSVVSERDAGGNVRLQTSVTLLAGGGGQVVRIDSDFGASNAPVERRLTVSGIASTETFDWDGEGRLVRNRLGLYANHPRLPAVPAVRTCRHDGFGRLAEVALAPDDPAQPRRVIHYRYDALGRRIERIATRVHPATGTVLSEEHTRYVFAGARCIEEHERDGAGTTWGLARRFVHGTGPRELVALLVDEAGFGEDIDGDGAIGGSATLLALQDHDHSLLGLVRLRQRANRFVPLVESYRSDASGRTTRMYVDPLGNERPIARSATGHSVHHHGQWLHEPEGLAYFGSRWYDPDLGVFIEPEPQGAWADPNAAGNAYAFAGGNPVLATDDDGEAVWVLVAVGVVVISVMLAADYTRNETLMSFSPAHNLVRAIVGHEIDDATHQVQGLDRLLAAIDAPLTILSFGGSTLVRYGAARLAAALQRGFRFRPSGLAAISAKIAAHEAAPLTVRQLARARRVIYDARAAWVRAGRASEQMIRWADQMPHGAVGAYVRFAGDTVERIWLRKGLFFASKETILRVIAHEAAHVKFALGLERIANRIERPVRWLLRIDDYAYEAGVFWLNEAMAYGVEFGVRFDFARALQSMNVHAIQQAGHVSAAITDLARRGLYAGPLCSTVRSSLQAGSNMVTRD